MRRRRIIKYLLLLSATLVVLFIALYFEAYQDWVFFCKNTISRKGYRQWPFGLKSGHWYKKSSLEEFIESNEPNALVHRWTVEGTGKNIFGMSKSICQEFPGAAYMLEADVLKLWTEKKDAKAIRELYDLLLSEDDEKIQERITEITNEVLETNQ